MTKFPLTLGYLYLCDGKYLKTAKIMVITTWGRVISCFNFSTVDYSVITEGHDALHLSCELISMGAENLQEYCFIELTDPFARKIGDLMKLVFLRFMVLPRGMFNLLDYPQM